MAIKRVNRGRNHSYIIDGKKALGVTTVLSDAWPKPWMGFWSAKCVAQQVVDMPFDDLVALRGMGRDAAIAALKQAPWTQRDQAAVRGTAVHKLAEKVQAGEQVEVPDELYGHVESVAKFLDQWNVQPVLVEKVVGSYKYGYAGTFDLVADLADGRRVLFDYKTSSAIKPTTALQLAAYRWADFYVADETTEIPMYEVGIDECKAVHVRADGYDVYPLDTDIPVFKAFLSTMQVAQAYKGEDDWVGAPEMPHDFLAEGVAA